MSIRKDITLVPHCYDIRWAKETNRILSDSMNAPVKVKETGYLRGRPITHGYLGRLLDYMRRKSKPDNKMFFTNLMEDFCFDFVKTTDIQDFYGLFVCTNHVTMVGSDNRLIEWENAVANVCKKVFLLTEFHKSVTPFNNSIVVGLPNTFPIQNPRLGKKIIFNHRLQSDKNIYEVFKMDENFKKNLIFSVPKASQNHLARFKKIFPVYFKPDEIKYKSIMGSCSFGITWCEHELFGVSIVECIASGMFQFVPATYAGYNDFTVKECRFNSISELCEKYKYYSHPDNNEERIDVILRCQKLIKKYQEKTWIKRVLKHIEE